MQGASAAEHSLQVEAAHYTPVDTGLIPTGALEGVATGGLDLRSMTPLAAVLAAHPDGLDHNFVLSSSDEVPDLRPVATAPGAPTSLFCSRLAPSRLCFVSASAPGPP